MWEAAKLFFDSKLGRSVLIGLALLISMAAAYAVGSSHGYAEGHDKGFTAGYDSRNTEVSHLQENVAALTKKINDDTKATNDKIAKIQEEAANAAVASQKKLAATEAKQQQIIDNYKATTPPEVQNKCALSKETVEAINLLIDSVNEEQPKSDSPARQTQSKEQNENDPRAVDNAVDALVPSSASTGVNGASNEPAAGANGNLQTDDSIRDAENTTIDRRTEQAAAEQGELQ